MEAGNNSQDIFGKKIFFLYPSSLVQNEIVGELIQQEFEIYCTREHKNLRRALKKYPNSILFINIDDGMPEKEWETYIRGLLGSSEITNLKIGILTSSGNEAIHRKYVNSVKVHCGVIPIKSNVTNATKLIFDTLQTCEAKGRRKYIRATTENETMTTINIPHDGSYINGTIRDISAVGLSCSFQEDPNLEKNSYFQDIQLKLQSMLLKVEGIVFGSRMEGMAKVYVILFTQKIDPDVRMKIRKYIQSNLQSKMDLELR
ncbi:PilZ domain-containing protein [Breznakiella homolactica]|uniref:PilZ domain-containing protein n=2 Tax=Breznakiella homolactica TaxID=2798577 RepID=A0A7T7XRS5_9SPIR|nr:PilZ domain-containing protein [Breznakiella homolactica]